MISQLLFACLEELFDDFWREIFFFQDFCTLTGKFLHFVQKSFNMSEQFSAVKPKFFDKHVKTAFWASIQKLWNLLRDFEKDWGTNRKKTQKIQKF